MKPYLSIVAASRNDNHGQDMLRRMRMFVNGLIQQCNYHKLYAELVIVEWNPPVENSPLSEALPAPLKGDYLSTRYITVPLQKHEQYRFSEVLPLYQMIAKNVGIRRSKADFILCTNVDVLFSDELMRELNAKSLHPEFFYRANRCDVPAAIDETKSLQEQLTFCSANIIRRLGYDAKYMHMPGVPGWVYRHTWLAQLLNEVNRHRRSVRYPEFELSFLSLDTKACGDFTLMHKTAWQKIKGYPELDLYSIHIDSMGLIAAAACGVKQFIFKPQACIYHIDHYNGWEAMTALEKVKFVNKRPGIGWDIVSETAEQLFKEKRTYDFNQDDWGFANEKFEEVVFNSFE
jgi:hypothetical protein